MDIGVELLADQQLKNALVDATSKAFQTNLKSFPGIVDKLYNLTIPKIDLHNLGIVVAGGRYIGRKR